MKVIKNLFFLSVLVMSFYACSTDELNGPIETSNKPNEIVHRTLSFEVFYNTFSNDKALLGKEIHTLAQTRKEHLKKAYSQSSVTTDTTKQIVVDYYNDPFNTIGKKLNGKRDSFTEQFVRVTKRLN